MTQFECINAFYNFIYGNERASMRNLVNDYNSFCLLRTWLNNHHVIVPSLNVIDEDMFNLLRSGMRPKDLSQLLHVDFERDLAALQGTYREKIHILVLPGVDGESWERCNIEDERIVFSQLMTPITSENLSFNDFFPAFTLALVHASSWPGALVFTEGKEAFVPLHSAKDIAGLKDQIFEENFFEHKDEKHTYYLQLSDLHLGPARKEKALESLFDSLDDLMPYITSTHKMKCLITGDLMNSPNRKNMYLANDFMNHIKKRYHCDMTFILGNHDMIVHGLNIGGKQKSKVIAYLLGESIKVLEDDKVILLKIDSTSQGNLARGMIGKRQLQEIEAELSAIDNLEEYTIVAMLHHHVYPISKAEFLKRKWNEKALIGKFVETSKILVDANAFKSWLRLHKIRYVLHGHKHVPYVMQKEGTYIVSAGSATGALKESESRYLSYNLLCYDHEEKRMDSCLIFYVDTRKAERLRVEVYLFKENENENSR